MAQHLVDGRPARRDDKARSGTDDAALLEEGSVLWLGFDQIEEVVQALLVTAEHRGGPVLAL